MEDKETHYLSKFYQKSKSERIEALVKSGFLSEESAKAFTDDLQLSAEIADSMIENQLATYQLPFGVALNFLIDDEAYAVPMAIEEPSVVAAASSAAKLFAPYGGFKTATTTRTMIGQVILTDIPDCLQAIKVLEDAEATIIQAANDAHPSIVRRGGGADVISLNHIKEDVASGTPEFLILHLYVKTLEAMGANIINTMMEAIIPLVEELSGGKALMGILSNYATECLATATCRIPAAALATNDWSGEEVRDRIVLASHAAVVDPYRAVTHNKGIMNGIDAVVIATGNDWRAISAGVHAYASRSGQYRSLTNWSKGENGDLVGELTIPLPIGAVGGSISFHPGAKIAHELLGNPSADTLESIIVSVGLAQNFSAIRALVTDGIQRGHMALHSRSLAISAGAQGDEIMIVSEKLNQSKNMNLATAKEILESFRQSE